MRRQQQHPCNLPIKDTSGLVRLPPNASRTSRLLRNLRKLFLLNPNNYKSTKMYRNKSSLLAERKRHASGPNSFVFHPMSIVSTAIDALFCIAWFYGLVMDPLMVFGSSFSWVLRMMQSKVIFAAKMIVIVYFFNVGYIDEKNKVCIVQSKKIIIRYLKTYFIFDLFSSYFPLFLATKITDMGMVECSLRYADVYDCYGIIYLFRLMCGCVRIYNLFETINDIFAIMGIPRWIRFLIIYSMKTFLYLHLLAFFLYYVSFVKYKGDWPAESWMTEANLKHDGLFYLKYYQALTMSICFFFAVDYRYRISLLEERVCAVIIMLFGRLYTLYFLADILTMFGIVGVSESMYERQILALHQYMHDKEIPESLKQRMIRYYKYKFQKRYFREGAILSTLSDHLRTELFLYTARKLVQKVEFFKRLSPTTLGVIIAAMKAEIFSAKDIIVKIDSEIEEIYFISSGTVAIINRDGQELCHLEDGDEFGSSCIVLKQQLFGVVAVETTEVFSINKNKFLDFLSPHSEVMIAFHRSVNQKLSRYRNLEDSVNQASRNIVYDLPNIMEQRTRRLIDLS